MNNIEKTKKLIGEIEEYQETIFDLERYKIMQSLVENTRDKIIIDFGAGWNPISKGMPSKKTILVDIRNKYNPDVVFDLNSVPLPFKDNFADILFAGEVIEHLLNPFNFLKELNRILKKDGILILSTPNLASFKNRIKLLFGLMPNFNAAKYPNDEAQLHHNSDWTIKQLKDFLIKSNFKIVSVKSNGIIYKDRVLINNKFCIPTFGDIIIMKGMKLK